MRWYKVLNDLWGNRTRTGLIVLSITVGLFAMGMIVNARIILSEELAHGYAAINPSSGTIRTVESFDQEFVRSVRRLAGVEEADGRAHIGMRFRVKGNGAHPDAASDRGEPAPWRDIQLFAVPDYDDMRVNRIRPQSGAWPPPSRALLLERSSLDLIGAQVGDWVVIETSDRKLREMRIAGLVHDLAQIPSQFDGMPRGYIEFDTLEWLGEPPALNELHIVAQNGNDKKEVLLVINRVKDRVEKSGFTIPMSTAAEPGEVPLDDILQSVLLLLGVLGFLSLFLSAFLIINTVSALVTQQIRQIGIMKAIGARAGQVVGMYLVLVLSYGLLATLIAVPLGAVGARALSQLMAGFFNFDLTRFYVAPQAICLQIAIGLLTPILSALYPIVGVLRITAAEAMSSYGVAKDQFGAGIFDRLLTGQTALGLRVLSRPLMLSLRNTFRRKGRLALTLVTLTLGGAMFIGVFSVRSSLSHTLSEVTQMYQSDVWVNFAYPQRVERIEQQALEVPGVVDAKGWTRTLVRRVRADESEGENLVLVAPPVEANLVRPVILEGRWLLPGESHALVVSTGAVNKEPDVRVGDEVVLKIGGRKASFRVVGVALGLGLAPFLYADYHDIARITQDINHAGSLMVVTAQQDPAAQAQIAAALETHLKQGGLRVSSMQLVSEENAGAETGFNLIIILALVMAFLLALVGGLGLMGTLSINVLERTREIGVMRAIGAADGALARVFMVEGIAIGAISWLCGTLIALPLSGLLSNAVGMSLLQAPLSYTFSVGGVLLWLVVVVVLSALASFLPARNASRLTVREVLAYE